MSQNAAFPIFKGTDADYLEAIVKIAKSSAAKQLGLSKLVLNPVGGAAIDNLTVENAANDERLKRILRAGGRAIRIFALKQSDHRQLQIVRSDDFGGGQPGQDYDKVTLTREPQFPNNLEEHFTALVAGAQNAVKTFSLDTFAPLLGGAAVKHLQAREEALTRLETLHARVLHELEDTRSALYGKAVEKESQLEESYNTRVQQLERLYQQRDNTLSDRETALDERKRQLDDRTSTHVRREIREKLLARLTDRHKQFALSPDTQKRRRWVAAIYVVLLVVFGVTTGYCMSTEGVQTNDYWCIGKRIASSLGFVITASFFLRWLNRWAQQHADEEFKAMQFELDFDRACFLVEMAFEFRAEKGEDIPPHLIESLSANLFGAKGGVGRDDSMTAADALVSLLSGVGGKAKLALPFGELELGRPEGKRLSKELKDEK